MQYSRHAGRCCGISVVYDFDGATLAQFRRVLSRHDSSYDHGMPGNRLLEAVLTDRQLNVNDEEYRSDGVPECVRNAGGWAVVLSSHDFVLRSRFRNSNTGRYCNVFHRVMERQPLAGLPWWNELQVAAPVPVDEPAVAPPEPINRWSEDFLTAETARIGLRVQYRHRERSGSTRLLDRQEGVISDIFCDRVSVTWDVDNDRRRAFYGNLLFNRFVYEMETPDVAVVEPEPEPAPVPPVVATEVQFFARRRDGRREGPFPTEEAARERWSRVREYIRVERTFFDGELQATSEVSIAA